MKNFLAILFFFSLFSNLSFAQSGNCTGASPFCTGTNYTFNNQTDNGDLGSVACLSTTPNPVWYYMDVDVAGPMSFTISQTNGSGSGIDVDYALWGPFSSLNAACSGTGNTPVSCSYSTAAVETATIPNAQVGQIYLLLITNYSNQAGTITFSQTSGTGSADCSFTCGVTDFTALPTQCSNNQYNVSGALTITNPPTTGTLTFTNSCGGNPVVLNAPFTSPVNYSFSNLTATGGQCTVNAAFSANPNCNTFQTYAAPNPCNQTTNCSISSVTANPSTCSNGTYSLGGAITFTNPPTTGTLTVTPSCGGTPQTFNAPFASPLNYNITGISANGQSCTVTASFSAAACSNTANYTAPAACGCVISAITATPSACANDLYSVSGNITFSTPPATGTLTVTNSCGGSQTFNAPFVSPLAYNLTNLNANGAACNITATFSALPTCTRTQPYTAPSPCLNPPCVTEPFCSNNGTVTFPAGTNQTAASVTYPGNNYGCLGSSPNPAWYYMQIANPGNFSINMSNSAGVDIDYILYGPYTSYNNAMTYCNNFGTAGSGTGTAVNSVIDCSFSSAANETATINNAVSGDVYVLLITNFSNSATNISFSSSGTATTDCSILTCSITNMTAVPSACNSTTNQYSLSGTITFGSAPTTGTLTVTSSCGGSQTFNPPFGTSVSYNLQNLTPNGQSCTVTASFSAVASCTSSLTYTAPAPCNCSAQIGTFTTNLTGNTLTQNKLCFGDNLNITSNNNWVAPGEIVGATTPGHPNYDATAPPYAPGIGWLIYSCPPTWGTTPAQAAATGQQLENDPCLVGIAGTTPNLTDVNDLSVINAFPAGTFTNNVVYYVPITMYNTAQGIYSYVILPSIDCYEMGTPIAVQYLTDITPTQTFNCANGTASITLTGGSPQFNGTNYTVVPGSVSPSTAVLVNNQIGNNGTIVLSNLTTGPYSFQVKDENGCPKTINGIFQGPQSATLTYPKSTYCLDENNPIATVIGDLGGTFTSGVGLTLNPTTGQINLNTSTPGAYTVTYNTPGPNCPASSSFNLTIEDYPIVSAGNDTTLCVGIPITLSGSGASSYTWNMGAQNGVPYLPNVGLNEFIVTGSSINGCKNIDTILVNVITDCITTTDVVFWVPNTFTPDGDQFNQTFKPIFYEGFDPYGYDFYMYNRWGELIWESHDVNFGWDGSYYKGNKCPDGIYTWKIRFKLQNNDEKRTVVGHCTLIR
ncbi:MAG: hypothetical protein RL264_2157 [Bacteroidota bacterium]